MFLGTKSRQIFFRGLAILLPTVLTIWILIAAYQFVQSRIAEPINRGIQAMVVRLAPWPAASVGDLDEAGEHLTVTQRGRWQVIDEQLKQQLGDKYTATRQIQQRRRWMADQEKIVVVARRLALQRWWESVQIGNWVVMDAIGLVVAIVLIYMVGVILSGYIGRRLYHRGEELIGRVPLIRRVYPSVKQVTDFFVGGDKQTGLKFSRVVAVEYPRRGIWSVGLVTGQTMRNIQEQAQEECLTVFIPSSPTPITGYVITVPQRDTIDLPVTIEDALKFTVSLGVLVPPSQQIAGASAPTPAGGGGRDRLANHPDSGDSQPPKPSPND